MNRKIVAVLAAAYVVCVASASAALLLAIDTGSIRFAEHDSVAGPIVLLVAAAIALLFLFAAIGVGIYVYRDAAKRGMDPLLWTVVAVLVPYFIGLVVYLVVRQSHGGTCPSCSAAIPEPANFCQSCGRVLRLQCPTCNAPVPADGKFCPACGTAIGQTAATK